MAAYYNEHDPKAAAWLCELIKAKLIADGEVDKRSIEDIEPRDLAPFRQCHFFAGIGGWSYAFRLAGIPDDRPYWTGSCPCQPFSAAGKGKGLDDKRHLWPAFFHLIEICRPQRVYGEQVAKRDGLAWLDLVQSDLEACGYTVGAVPMAAAGFGPPHIRERLYWVADAHGAQHPRPIRDAERNSRNQTRMLMPCSEREDGGLADASVIGHERAASAGSSGRHGVARDGSDAILADTASGYASPEREQRGGQHGFQPQGDGDGRSRSAGTRPGIGHNMGRPSPTNGQWRDVDWLWCRDERWRPVEPGLAPLADGIPARVVRVRGYGNAIVPSQAAAFIEVAESVMEKMDWEQ